MLLLIRYLDHGFVDLFPLIEKGHRSPIWLAHLFQLGVASGD